MALTKIPRGLLDTGIADSSDATAITIDSSENVTFAGNILKTGDLTLDVSGDFIFDADGGDIKFLDGGTEWGRIQNGTGSQLILQSKISDEDMLFQGNDGGSNITALTLDMSAAGAATFNSGVTLSGHLDIAYSGGNITWASNYTAIGNIKNSQATLLGNNIKAGATNNTIVRHANGTDAGNFIGITYNKGVTFHTGITTTQNSDVAETTNERVRIDTTGKVGIGTDAPGALLHLYNSSNAQITFQNSTTGTTVGSDGYDITLQGSDIYHILRDSGNQRFYTAGTERMRINTSGYVGIGETSPDNKLHITGADWNNAHIRIERTDVGGSNDAGLVFKSAAGAATDTGLGGIWFQNALDGNAYALIRARTDDSSGTSGRLDFITDTTAVGNATNATMTIDSSGIITTPQRPLFMAYGSGGWTTMAGTGNNPVILSSSMWTEQYDVKGNFTPSNGRFTAPVLGWYQFIFNSYTRANDTSGYCYPTFFKNGSQWTYGNQSNILHYQNHADEDLGFNKVAMIYMAKDDYVQVGYYTYGSNNPVSYHGASIGFSGYLIG